MTLDSEEQRGIILAMINGTIIKGEALEKFYEFKEAVKAAEVKEVV